MKKLFSIFLSLCLLFLTLPVQAEDQIYSRDKTEYSEAAANSYSTQDQFIQKTVVAYSNFYEEPIQITVYLQDNQLYLDADTVSAVTGFEKASGSSGTGFSLSGEVFSVDYPVLYEEKRLYPLESTMKKLLTNVYVSSGMLVFLSEADAVKPLRGLDATKWRQKVFIDSEDDMSLFGYALANIYQILTTWNLNDYLDRYRSALYAILQQESGETRLTQIAKDWEKNINQPISQTLQWMDTFSSFLGDDNGSSSLLQDYFREYTDGISYAETAMTMSMSQYYSALQMLVCVCEGTEATVQGLQYLSEVTTYTDTDKEIANTAAELIRQIGGTAEDKLGHFTLNIIRTQAINLTAGFLSSAVSSSRTVAQKLVLEVISRMDGISSIPSYTDLYVFDQIQNVLESGISQALSEGDYLKAKYLLLMYYRCFICSCNTASDIDMSNMTDDWSGRMNEAKSNAQAAVDMLLLISDPQLNVINRENYKIDADELTFSNQEPTLLASLQKYTYEEIPTSFVLCKETYTLGQSTVRDFITNHWQIYTTGDHSTAITAAANILPGEYDAMLDGWTQNYIRLRFGAGGVLTGFALKAINNQIPDCQYGNIMYNDDGQKVKDQFGSLPEASYDQLDDTLTLQSAAFGNTMIVRFQSLRFGAFSRFEMYLNMGGSADGPFEDFFEDWPLQEPEISNSTLPASVTVAGFPYTLCESTAADFVAHNWILKSIDGDWSSVVNSEDTKACSFYLIRQQDPNAEDPLLMVSFDENGKLKKITWCLDVSRLQQYGELSYAGYSSSADWDTLVETQFADCIVYHSDHDICVLRSGSDESMVHLYFAGARDGKWFYDFELSIEPTFMEEMNGF